MSRGYGMPGARAVSRRQFLKTSVGLLAAGAFPTLSGCKPARPLAVAINPWPGFAFVEIARRHNRFTSGQVQILSTPHGGLSSSLLREGKVNAAMLTLDEVMTLELSGIDLSVVLVCDVSVGADALMARPEIRTLRELKGKRVGVETSTLGELMLVHVLEKAGLSRADIIVVPMSGAHDEAWNSQRLDAVITYEPTVTRLASQGALRLFDSQQAPDAILDVLAVRTEVLETHAHHVSQMIHGHFVELMHWKQNPYDSSFQLAEVLGLPAESIRRIFGGLLLPDLDYNRHLLFSHGKALEKTLADIWNIVKKQGAGRSNTMPDVGCTDALLPEEIA